MVDTLQFGHDRGWKQIIFGHIGRKAEGSLAKVAKRLGEMLECDVPLISDWLDEVVNVNLAAGDRSKISAAKPGDVIMLENTRKYEIEPCCGRPSRPICRRSPRSWQNSRTSSLRS